MHRRIPYGCVYLMQNLIDGKAYVGATRQSPAMRFKTHRGVSRRLAKGLASRDQAQLVTQAMALHGAEAFALKAAWPARNEADLDGLEREKIAECGTLAPSGYNIELGGIRGAGKNPYIGIVLSEILRRSSRAADAHQRWHDQAVQRKARGVHALSDTVPGRRLMNWIYQAGRNAFTPVRIPAYACNGVRRFLLESLGVAPRYQSVSREERARRQSAAQQGKPHPHRGVTWSDAQRRLGSSLAKGQPRANGRFMSEAASETMPGHTPPKSLRPLQETGRAGTLARPQVRGGPPLGAGPTDSGSAGGR